MTDLRRVIQALREGKVQEEQIDRAFRKVQEELREELPDGVMILELYIAMLHDSGGIDDLEQLVLASDEARDLSAAEPGTPEFKRRAAHVAAARFAAALAEELGLTASAQAATPGDGRDRVSGEQQEDTGGTTQVSQRAPPEETAGAARQKAPLAAVPRDTLSRMSRAQLIDLIEQLEAELLSQEMETAHLRRTLQEHGLAEPQPRPAEHIGTKDLLEACRERLRNLEKMLRECRHRLWMRASRKEREKVSRAVVVLMEMQRMGGEASVAQICRSTGMSRAQTWRYFRALAESGLITEVQGNRGMYRLPNTLSRMSQEELERHVYWRWQSSGHLGKPLSEPRTRKESSISGGDTPAEKP